MIRLPDIPGLRQTAINAPGVSARALAAPAIALDGLAQSIGRVSEQFHARAVQVQKLENARVESERRTQLAESYAQLQRELETDPDPQSHLDRTMAFLQQSKGLMEDPSLPPAARDSLRMHFDSFASQARIRSGEISSRLAIKRAFLAAENEVGAAVAANDEAGAMAAIDRMLASGAVLPEEADAQRTKVKTTLRHNRMVEEIKADPLGAEKRLADPRHVKDLSPEQLHSLQTYAEREANRYRADFVDELTIAGVTPTADELAAMEAFGKIDKSTHARWLTKIRAAAVPVMDPAIYEETYGQIMSYDPAKDPSGRVEAQLRAWVASQPLPEASIKELNERLTKKLNPAEARKPKSVHESAFASKIAADFNRGDWGKFRFPFDHDNNPSTAPVMRVTREEYDKAWRLRGMFTDQWRATLASLPDDAPFETVQSAYEALKKFFADKKPVPEIKLPDKLPLAIDPDKVYQGLAPQASFGGQPVKAAGESYQGAAATVFGGPDDPNDNGRSALGGKTGPGGREGSAVPKDLLSAKFPGKDKTWIAANVRTVVRDPQGVMHTLKVADFGTAEWVWKRNGRPTLDLTEGAVKELGGKVIYQNGRLAGVKGLDALDFAVVSIDTGGLLAGQAWEDVKSAWFRVNKPRNHEAATTSLVALRDAWHQANAEEPFSNHADEMKRADAIIEENTRIAAGNH